MSERDGKAMRAMTRDERLAAQLRENLRRRKAQAKAKAQPDRLSKKPGGG